MKEQTTIFMVQVNITELSHYYANLLTLEDQGLFLQGFMQGVHGGIIPPDSPDQRREGLMVGSAARARALDYRNAKEKAGRKGGKIAQLKRLEQLKQG